MLPVKNLLNKVINLRKKGLGENKQNHASLIKEKGKGVRREEKNN